MAVTLGFLRKIDKAMCCAAVSGNNEENKLECIHICRLAQGTGCGLQYGEEDCFESHWYKDPDEMTQCLLQIQKFMKKECTERDLYDFAFSVFHQAIPSRSDMVWLYFLNLTDLFEDIRCVYSREFWELLLSGIKENSQTSEAGLSCLVIYDRFEVKLEQHSNMTMVYVGLIGHGVGPEYLKSENGTEFPIMKYISDQGNTTPNYIYYPTRSHGSKLKWMEPARVKFYDNNLDYLERCFRAILNIFKSETPYAVIGETFHVSAMLYPIIANNHVSNYMKIDNIPTPFVFKLNPLSYAIARQDFVRILTAVGFQRWGYTPMPNTSGMECGVVLYYTLTFEDTTDKYYDLQEAGNSKFDITMNVSFKGVLNGDFRIIRSTKTNNVHSAAGS